MEIRTSSTSTDEEVMFHDSNNEMENESGDVDVLTKELEQIGVRKAKANAEKLMDEEIYSLGDVAKFANYERGAFVDKFKSFGIKEASARKIWMHITSLVATNSDTSQFQIYWSTMFLPIRIWCRDFVERERLTNFQSLIEWCDKKKNTDTEPNTVSKNVTWKLVYDEIEKMEPALMHILNLNPGDHVEKLINYYLHP